MHKIKYILWVIFLCLMVNESLFAQIQIVGTVIDNQTREPIPGVNISISDSVTGKPSSGTVTDQRGDFALPVIGLNTILIVSAVGYHARTIKASTAPQVIELEESLVELNQLVVSASRGSQSRTEAPMAISKLPTKLLNEAKATTLDQVLNKVSGVFMVNLGNEQHSMSIRQPLTLKSLFLYLEDGIPIRPTGVFNHNALIEMNMASLKTIEVIKGPASSIYGSEAIGGSINFITQIAPAYPSARLAVQGDNLGYQRVDFEAGSTLGKLGVYAGGYYSKRKDGLRDHSDFDKLAITLRADYKLSEHDKITTTATLIDYKADMTGSIDSANFYSKNYPSLHTFTYREVKALRLRSTLDHFWNDRSKTSFNLFYRNNLIGQNPSYRVRNDAQNALLASGEINESTYQSFGTVMQHVQEWNWLESRLIGGMSLDYSPNQYLAEFIEVQRNENGFYSGFSRLDSLLTDYSVNLLNTAAYAQFEISPVDRLKLVLAARYDLFNYRYDNHLNPDEFSGAPDATNKFHSISPKVGLTYDFGKDRGVYANYSIGFVPPQVTELYRGVKVPVLEPSVYHNYEVGGWFSFSSKGYADISLYQLEGTNEIISVFLDDGTTENRNAGKTMHSGIEYSLHYSPVENLRFRFGGSNAIHEYSEFVEGGNDYSGNRMNAAPGWMANAEAFYYPSFLKGFRIGVEWQHMHDYFMDPANTEKYEGFDVLNLRLGYEVKGLEAWVNVLNLTDELYATNASKSRFGKSYSPADPRTISAGVAYRLSIRPKSKI